jgi:uncharacterized protein (DUF362 family)
MKQVSRREFIKMTAAGLGALALQPWLAACDRSEQATVKSELPEPGAPTGRQEPIESDSTPVQEAIKPGQSTNLPDLVVARNGEPEDLVRNALAALGGMERFVPKGASVIVKPNICVAYHSYEYAATTNPWVVGALVRLAMEAGARSVQVMDFPFGGSAEEAYVRSGIQEQVLAAGGEMVTMPRFKYEEVDLPDAVDLKRTQAFKDALAADVLIDVPIAKHHGQARLTLGMKNLMGLVLDRGAIHRNLGQRIADLASLFRPDLTVVDAVRILTAHGPSGGNLNDVQKLDTVIASADIVAADSYATTLFGKQPSDIAYITAASQMGLGRSDLENMRIEEITAGV